MLDSKLKTILVVDDDHDIRLSLELLLKGKGYRLEFATNGQEALDYLKGKGMPDLILLDMAMPVMDGWEFARNFRECYTEGRSIVVVMTAAADAKKRAEEVQADGFLSKPYSLRSLLETVETHLQVA